jgi:UDP:flavonoid glycosyltransferase YjiC (YdhE family)
VVDPVRDLEYQRVVEVVEEFRPGLGEMDERGRGGFLVPQYVLDDRQAVPVVRLAAVDGDGLRAQVARARGIAAAERRPGQRRIGRALRAGAERGELRIVGDASQRTRGRGVFALPGQGEGLVALAQIAQQLRVLVHVLEVAQRRRRDPRGRQLGHAVARRTQQQRRKTGADDAALQTQAAIHALSRCIHVSPMPTQSLCGHASRVDDKAAWMLPIAGGELFRAIFTARLGSMTAPLPVPAPRRYAAMKFAIATYGTEGDVRPLAALCRTLIDAGHEATLLADGATLGHARALGVPARALSGDIKGTLDPSAAISQVVGKANDLGSTAQALAGIANANAHAWLKEIAEAGEGCDALVVSALASFAGLSAAEHLGIPCVGASFIPISPTSAFASPFLPPRVPRMFNRLSHTFVNALLWRAFRKATNDARASVFGMPPRRRNWTTHPMLYGVSPSLVPTPSDWPQTTRICGQWLLPAGPWSPPDALAAFLAAGEAPVYVGFGSMVGFDRPALLKEVIAAVGGRRALFYPGWSGDETPELPGNFFVLGDTPHDWLLPQVSLAIHHGGSGTTHSVARAGVPSVVVPFAGDQAFWADRLRRAGVAAEAVSGHQPDAASMARAIEFAERDDVRTRARDLGERMRAENGLAMASGWLEQWVMEMAAATAAMRQRSASQPV